jgi:hypothetical protein
VQGSVDPSTCGFDCGQDVSLTAYSEQELSAVVATSVQILTDHGFDRARSFRAGGWMANRAVLRALAENDITFDGSATDGHYLDAAWAGANLPSFVRQLWPRTTRTSQPQRLDLGDGLSILEMPNNGCLADYATGASIFQTFVANAAKLRTAPSADVYVSIGFHQETAATYLTHVREGLAKIASYASDNGIAYDFIVGPF